MDPLSAISVAASIAQFVNMGLMVMRRLKEYKSATTDVPKSLQHIATQLPVLLSALDKVKTGNAVEGVDLDTRCILKGVVAGCRQQVEKVDSIISKVLHVPGDSLATKVQKVFVSLKNDEKVLAIEKNLQTYISILILHRVIEGTEATSAAFDDTYFFEVRARKPANFRERVEMIQDIESRLHPAATLQALKPIQLALVGPEAAGKTQIAVDYCHQAYAAGQFQTIFWANATTPENLSRSLEGICDIIRRSKEGMKDRDEKIEFVKSFLTNRWHPWLLVLDNYYSAGFENVLDFLPSHGCGAVLFTSRYEPFSTSGQVIYVPKFRNADEIEFLRSSLAVAVRSGKIDQVAKFLADGADPDSRELGGWPCLHRAVNNKNIDMVKILLLKGASSRGQSPPHGGADGYVTALYWAAFSGSMSITQLLLDHEDKAGLTPQAPGNNAILRVAAERGHEEIVRLLVEHGSVQVNGRNDEDETALGLAAKKGRTAVVKLLLDYRADPEANSSYQTPLTWAASNNHLETVKVLHQRGKANVNAGDSTSGFNSPSLISAICDSGREKGCDDLVEYLLESGAIPNRSDKDGPSPLQRAACCGYENQVSMLLEFGADPYPSKSQDEDSPICQAAECGHEGIVKLLLGAKAKESTVKDSQREMALISASIRGHRKVILLLLDTGININVPAYKKQTPLIYAIEKGKIPTARLLLRQKASVDTIDEYGRSPLFLAVEKGFDIVVKDILRSSGKPDVHNSSGETPLCLAVAKGHEKVVEVLLEHGAGRNFANKFGETPLDLAEEHKLESIIRTLEGPEIIVPAH